MAAERWSRLHPARGAAARRTSSRQLAGTTGPIVAATDYMPRAPRRIRPFVPRPYTVLGTDGFGRSDYRVQLRRFFEVDRHHVAVAALGALATTAR